MVVRNSTIHEVIRGYVNLCEDVNLVRCVGVAKRIYELNLNQIINELG